MIDPEFLEESRKQRLRLLQRLGYQDVDEVGYRRQRTHTRQPCE